MRSCRTCGQSFEPTPNQIKKYDHECRLCGRGREMAWRAARKAAGYPNKSGRRSLAREREYNLDYLQRPEVKERRARVMRERIRDPKERYKHEARWAAKRAISNGRLVRKPCEVCGAPKVDSHHDDYSRPLEVRWLCREHHVQQHAFAGGVSTPAPAEEE